MMARKKPVKAPRKASVTERLLNVRRPWLVRMNPVYAMATVQRIARTGNITKIPFISDRKRAGQSFSEDTETCIHGPYRKLDK